MPFISHFLLETGYINSTNTHNRTQKNFKRLYSLTHIDINLMPSHRQWRCLILLASFDLIFSVFFLFFGCTFPSGIKTILRTLLAHIRMSALCVCVFVCLSACVWENA